MNAPNMAFFGHNDTRDMLKIIKEATNNEEFDISFKNKEGKLKILKETMGGWIDYVREVGGKYLLRFSKNGVMDTKSSDTDTATARIERKKDEKYSDEELMEIAKKTELLNKLEGRDDEEE